MLIIESIVKYYLIIYGTIIETKIVFANATLSQLTVQFVMRLIRVFQCSN